MYKRNDVIKELKGFLVKHPKVYTVWEGGSAATNRLDEYSDLDLMIVTEKEDIESLYQELEVILNNAFVIEQVYKIEEPSWHGFSQRFYKLKKTEPYFYIDLCILPKDVNDPFTASDRHGVISAWKDTINFIVNTKTDESIIYNKAKKFYNNAVKSEFIMRLEIEKAFKRDNFLDAYSFSYSYLMRHLAPLLNILHRIARVDFGIRYAKQEYSFEDYNMIIRFFEASDMIKLKDVFKLMIERFELLSKETSILLDNLL